MARGVDKTRCERCRAEVASGAVFCPQCGTPRTRPEDDPLLGEVVGDRYRIRERVGQGGSGAIYSAEHVTLKRKVAVKVLYHELSRDDLAVERFRREATTVGEIDNEHIVEVYDFGRMPDGRLFLAMEHLEGETLSQVIREKGQLPIPQAIDVLTQVGEALMEAHAMGYVHRDLRPSNVMLARRRGRTGFVKLLDFGLAKLVEREGEAASTSLGMTFGDPSYMSPEQAKGDPVDRRADIYSLGVMAYEMLSGQPPFTGKKVFDVLMQHIEKPAVALGKLRPDCPPWLESIVMRALAKRADERFVTVYRFVEALREGARNGTVMSDEAARSMPAIDPPPPAPRPKEAPAVPAVPAAKDGLVPTPVPGSLPTPDPKPNNGTSNSPSARVAMKAMAKETSGMSGAWYADGEELAEGVPQADKAPAAPPPKSAPDPELTRSAPQSPVEDTTEPVRNLSASSSLMLDGSMDSVFGRRRPNRKAVKLAAALLGVAVLAFILLAVWPRGGKDGAEGVAADAGARAALPPDAAGHAALGGSRDGGPQVAVTSSASGPGKVKTPDHHPPVVHKDKDPDEEPDEEPPPGKTAVVDFRPKPDAGPPPNQPKVSAGDAAQADFYVKLGDKALREGDPVGAATDYNKAREFDNTNAEAIAGLGEVAMRQGFYDDASVHLAAASRLAPRSSRIAKLWGQACLAAGKKEDAAEAFKKALKINPDDNEAIRGYKAATGG